MSYPVAVVSYVRGRILRIRFFKLVLPVIRENLFNSDLSLESTGTVGMAIEETAGLTDLKLVRTYQH